MNPLDILHIPLRGAHLVEASAGTGKTWNIARLYLRLLLEESSASPPLPIDRIVVVTYTNAATDELRARIRALLQQSLSLLDARNGLEADTESSQLLALLHRTPLEQCRARLTEALIRMDEALISTIHGYCLRALQEHAFESGLPFQFEMQPDESALQSQVMEDFWRCFVVPLTAAESAALRAWWSTPDQLLRAIRPLLSREGLRLLPENCTAELARAEQTLLAHLDDFRGQWPVLGSEVQALLETSPALNRKSYTPAIIKRLLAQLDGLAGGTGIPPEPPPDLHRLTPDFLNSHCKKNTTPPLHTIFLLCAHIHSLLPEITELRKANWRIQAMTWCAGQLQQRKEAAQQLHYDDLLRALDKALLAPRGAALAARLREQAPVALIDEFQDTDPLQWRIFQRIYHKQPQCGIFLIGDPKQAIYAFRGADIFSYIQAKRQVGADSRHTLDQNWRAHSRLVEAVNRLFQQAPEPFMIHPQDTPDIPFFPASAAGLADRPGKELRVDGQALSPFRIRLLTPPENGNPLPKGQAQEEAARLCAADIARLIRLGQANQATLGERPLTPGDIGVLVRSHTEGSAIRQALRQLGIASVSLSRDNVFATPEARDLALLLAALFHDPDGNLLRAALCTELLGLTMGDLITLADDEEKWDILQQRFQAYREQWLQRSFLEAFFQLLHGENIPARLLRLPGGERKLTNLLQLGELLQEATGELTGPEGLLRWFAKQRAESSRDNENQQLRLENDEQLVRIVTVHKSKGLQYPLVFLPFFCLCSGGGAHGSDSLLFHDPENLQLCVDLGSGQYQHNRILAWREELAQEMRLFYVAVTRAEQLCVLTWGRVKDLEQSAAACLLHPVKGQATGLGSCLGGLDTAAMRSDLETLTRKNTAFAILDPDTDLLQAAPDTSAVPVTTPPPNPLRSRRFRGRIHRDWRRMSYTRLAYGVEQEHATLTEGPERTADFPDSPAQQDADDSFHLQGGVRLGNFLHCLLEGLNFPGADKETLTSAVRNLSPRFALGPNLESGLVQLLTRMLDTPLLEPDGPRLRDLASQDCLRELRFHFPLDGSLAPGHLRQILAGFPQWRHAADGLRFDAFQGLMTGSIDLVFRYQGRYYLADYKSNYLGGRLADYSAANLTPAMRRHRYELQCLIYTLALHRYLQHRKPDYHYEADCGGAWYLFLRGMRPALGPASGIWHGRPPLALVEAMDQLFHGGLQ